MFCSENWQYHNTWHTKWFMLMVPSIASICVYLLYSGYRTKRSSFLHTLTDQEWVRFRIYLLLCFFKVPIRIRLSVVTPDPAIRRSGNRMTHGRNNGWGSICFPRQKIVTGWRYLLENVSSVWRCFNKWINKILLTSFLRVNDLCNLLVLIAHSFISWHWSQTQTNDNFLKYASKTNWTKFNNFKTMHPHKNGAGHRLNNKHSAHVPDVHRIP